MNIQTKSLKNCKIQNQNSPGLRLKCTPTCRLLINSLLTSVLVLPLFPVPAFSSQKIDLESEAKKLKVVTLYSETESKALMNLPLAVFKSTAIEKKTEDCHKTYDKAWSAGKSVRGWVALNYLLCFEGTGKVGLQDLSLKINEWHKEGLFNKGPWAPDLKTKIVTVAFEKDPSEFPKNLTEWYLQNTDLLSSTQKASLMLEKAKTAKKQSQWEELAFRFEQIRALDSRLVSVNEMNEVYAKLNWPLIEIAPKIDTVKKVETKKENTMEVSFAERILAKPSSKSMSEWRKEFLETYDKKENSGEGIGFIKALTEVSPLFIGDWAEALHRRGDYAAGLELLRPLIEKNLKGPEDYKLYWAAGRCAQFLGRYEEAVGYFTTLEARWSEVKESQEAQFRKGLIFYRLQNWSETAKVMSQLKEIKSDRFELGARYWEIRALEKQKQNVNALKQELVQKYPWSYYGLRLQAELGNGQWKTPVLDAVKSSDERSAAKKENLRKAHVWLDGDELKAFERLKTLLQNGMQEEAHAEAKLLPPFAQVLLVKALSEFYQSGHLWLPAIIQMNKAQELEKSYLSWEITKEVFPTPYASIYQEEAKQNKLPVELLWSLSRQESGFNTRATSTSNAMGLMQLIPPTAKEVAQKLKLKLNLPQDAYRPTVNIKMGSSYIGEVVAQFGGSIPLGLAGYNAGPHKVKKWMEQREETKLVQGLKSSDPDMEIWFDELPWSETSFYVKAILRNLTIYRLIQIEDKNQGGVNKLQSGVDLGPVWWM